MSPEEREALLAGYALGSLSARDALDAERLVRTDPDAAAEYETYRELTDLIALSVPLRRADPSLRRRVLDAARSERTRWRRGWFSPRHLPVAALAAALALVVFWGANLQQSIDALQEQNAVLTRVLEAEVKRIESMGLASNAVAQTRSQQLERVLREQQTILAVQADPNAMRVELEQTQASHGAHGHYLWSEAEHAGILIARNLPPLPLGSNYKVWVRDSLGRLDLVESFAPDTQGAAQVVLHFPSGAEPVRLYLIASAATSTSSEGPIVLHGRLDQASKVYGGDEPPADPEADAGGDEDNSADADDGTEPVDPAPPSGDSA